MICNLVLVKVSERYWKEVAMALRLKVEGFESSYII